MIYFIRHGQTDWNKQFKIQGRHDIPLNAEGRAEAQKLKQSLVLVKFDAAFSSPLKRAKETAKAVWDGELLLDERLSERLFGEFEGKRLDGEDFRRFWSVRNELKVSNAETINEVLQRVKSFVEEVSEKYRGQNVLAATHGGVMMAVKYLYCGGENVKNLFDLLPKNTEIVLVDNA